MMLSVITPCFNEADNVAMCVDGVRQVMNRDLPDLHYEHIFIDNSSSDQTVPTLKLIAAIDPHVKIIVNSRNVGPFKSMWHALSRAEGDAVVPFLPADLQDPPEVIPAFVEKWIAGDLVVYGLRVRRQEHLPMRLARGIYYRLVNVLSGRKIPINAGEFLLADRRVIDSILAVDDAYPYIRGLVAQTEVRAGSVPYTWLKRGKGRSKLHLVQLFDQAINGLVSTTRVPARLALVGGFLLALCGIVGGLVSLFLVATSDGEISAGIPTIIVSVFFFSGFQLFFLGVVGEYVMSIHGQVRRPPEMFELEIVNF
jgi:glycosyltransferase involved in cell wall biosynthesis